MSYLNTLNSLLRDESPSPDTVYLTEQIAAYYPSLRETNHRICVTCGRILTTTKFTRLQGYKIHVPYCRDCMRIIRFSWEDGQRGENARRMLRVIKKPRVQRCLLELERFARDILTVDQRALLKSAGRDLLNRGRLGRERLAETIVDGQDQGIAARKYRRPR
jgi:hypothetical protein